MKNNSFIWSAVGVYSIQALNFLSAAILSRILTPEDFGIVSTFLVVNGLLVILASLGISQTIIQFRDNGKEWDRNILNFSILFGIFFALVIYFSAPYISTFFKEEALTKVFEFGAVIIVFHPPMQVVLGYLVREFSFRKKVVLEVGATVFSTITSVIMALNGFGYWSMLVQMAVRPIIVAVAGLVLVRLLPSMKLDFGAMKRVLGYLRDVGGFKLFNYSTNNVDNFFIARRLGLESLGTYSRAFQLYNLTVVTSAHVVTPVMHSIFSAYKGNTELIVSYFVKVIREMFILFGCLMTLCFIFADSVIYTCWGGQWEAAVFPFKMLCILGAFKPIFSSLNTLFMGLDQTGEYFKWTVLNFTLIAFSLWFTVDYGIDGVALTIVVSTVIVGFAMLFRGIVVVGGQSLSLFFSIFKDGLLHVALLLVIILGYFAIVGGDSHLFNILCIVSLMALLFLKRFKSLKSIITKHESHS